MVLGAKTLGLSSCINCLVMIGLKQNKKLRKILGFTCSQKAYAAAGFGYPAYAYPCQVFRKPARFRVL